MSRRRQIYEGSAKVLFEGPEPGTLVQHFKDDAADRQKRGTITGKGVLNNRICEFLMLKLAEIGIPTHFVRRASTQDLDEIMQISLRVNDFLTGLFLGIGIRLVDFGLEFGRLYGDEDVRIVVADEISPDNMRLWDIRTSEKLDKDRFREDLERVAEGYQEVARRLGILPEGGPADFKGPRSMQ